MILGKLDIGKQLKLVVSILVIVVGCMSLFSIFETNQLSSQTKILYDHPLQVRRALDNVKINQQKMSVAVRDMVLAETEGDRNEAYERLIWHKSQIPTQIAILRDAYLGPEEDIEAIQAEYIIWEESVLRNAGLMLEGDMTKAVASFQSNGEISAHGDHLEEKLGVVDAFAKQKADTLHADSEMSRKSVTWISMVVALGLMMGMYEISRRLYHNIQNPLRDLVRVIRQVDSGVLSARSTIVDQNEFGKLADGLNGMLETIEEGVKLKEKSALLSSIMLADDDMDTFFTALLSGLMKTTNSQLGGVYLLSEEKNAYELYVSIGMDEGKRTSFDRASLEGELGLARGNREIQVLKQIQENTRFVYPAAVGTLLPKELTTIPLVNQKETFAFVTLGSIAGFDDLTIELLEKERTIISTRMQSVLDLQQIKLIKEKLETQNRELEAQKTELDALSLELGEQNRELEQQKTELSEANRLKTNFLSNMSHELRTPLNSVIALSGVLDRRLQGRISEEESQYLEVIGRSGKNLLEMINEILDISRIESGREEVEMREFDIRELVEELLRMLDPIAEEKGIELRHEVIGKKSVLVSDEKKIRHIVQNLLSNAIKFTEEGIVGIVAKLEQEELELTVSDTGIGIAKENQESIFEEFRQADSSTTRMYGGTGLGLAIAKRYAEFLGGSIRLESDLGEGSVFVVSIPVTDQAVDTVAAYEEIRGDWEVDYLDSAQSWKESQRGVEDKKHLLIVEDSEPAIVQLQDVFTEEGYQISAARDGYEAIQMIMENQPDGIILDLMMPRIDGFEVLRTIRERELTAHIPVLVLSAKHITKEELSQLKHNHVHQLIQKGNVNLEALKQAVTSMLHPVQKMERAKAFEIRQVTEKPVILVVEDNPDNRLTARAVLEEKFHIIEAENGEDAIVMAEKAVPDLILMDNALPGMDGVDAFRAIRKKPELAHIPVIALTASAMKTDREIFLAYGFDGFIPKPIIEEELLQSIRGVLYGV